MKKLMVILAATILMASGTAMAANDAKPGHDPKCLKECQMLVKNCDREVDSLPQKISKLKTEIQKGASLYTPDELRTLERNLKESEDLLNNLTYGG
ncbi:hypothetical protein LPW11_07025 [Geomonas sp. RF6]|uniref:hypothetical protein n=1 Tax=Geomonas sp. RF6 TaxID=2897342 RepID=UPI001E37D709|nr:hypothetical protein [Geomonas sp. RF6]UFS71937.1 hypothetical protein LPW11_07025 [Geomonas sp. RF6]